ncbi:MAG: hypothetical protein ACP5I3_12030 [Thermoproteus sp.]
MRFILVPVKCPKCGNTITAAPGVKTVCPYCGAEVYVPPERIPENPYADCEPSNPNDVETAELLRRAKSTWPLPADLISQLEFLKSVGVIECR